jgi:ATP/maltotriose-dependent transcriptional regulator MalT
MTSQVVTNRKRRNEVLKLSSQGYGEREVGNKLHVSFSLEAAMIEHIRHALPL